MVGSVGVDAARPAAPGFYISYADEDLAWARWVAAVLVDAGHTAVFRGHDLHPGSREAEWVNRQLGEARSVIALCSPAYFASRATVEFELALSTDALIPFVVVPVDPPPAWRDVYCRDLSGLVESQARAYVLADAGVAPLARSVDDFPGRVGSVLPAVAAFPGLRPAVWNVPARNGRFVGREAHLAAIHTALESQEHMAMVAVTGLGGVGKSQLAIEYAHRYRDRYAMVWWINASQGTLVQEQYAELSRRCGLAVTGAAAYDMALARDFLGRRAGWLVVFDDAERSSALASLLPDGPGHVLITSQSIGWGSLTNVVLDVEVLSRDEATDFLTHRVANADPGTAAELARELGDLPLALEQAAACVETMGLSLGEVLGKLRRRPGWLMGRGEDIAHGENLKTLWQLSLQSIGTRQSPAGQFVEICAHLGPEPIPLSLFENHPQLLPAPLSDVVADNESSVGGDMDIDDVVSHVLQRSLARRADGSLQFHRLVQVAIRANQTATERARSAEVARSLLNAQRPSTGPEDPAGWPAWAILAPQVLTAHALHPNDGAVDYDMASRRLLIDTGWYLYSHLGSHRRDGESALLPLDQFASKVHIRFTEHLGRDHPDTLAAATCLAVYLREIGRADAAVQLDRSVFKLYTRMYGADDERTLTSANNLALDYRELGEVEAAHRLDRDTAFRRRQALGAAHPATLTSNSNLAGDLRAMGEFAVARSLDEETWRQRSEILGPRHPDTLTSANNLAADLRGLREYRKARELDEATFEARSQVLGNNHHATRESMNNLAVDLHELGDT